MRPQQGTAHLWVWKGGGATRAIHGLLEQALETKYPLDLVLEVETILLFRTLVHEERESQWTAKWILMYVVKF